MNRQIDRAAGWRLLCCALLLWGVAVTPAAAGYHSMIVTVTAYNSTPDQTSGDPNEGAWGDRLEPGMRVVAVSPDLVRMGLRHGTHIAIAGFKKEFVVMDKTSSALRRRVDIYMGLDVKRALEFGRQRLRIWWHTPD